MKNKATPRLELPEISRIGFGGHLTSVKNKTHHEALEYALLTGCNLLDTSANYMKGESEELIGAVLQQTQLPAFVVTKSGYHQAERRKLQSLLDKVSSNLLHPDFLSNRISVSRSRLNGQIDAYLLHNPEHYYTHQPAQPQQEEFYSRIKFAFEFLEQEVQEKTIRYYGISSNTFPLSTEDEKVIRLKRIMEIANSVSTSHHFRFIEFPFNLAETEALLPLQQGTSLLNLAQEYNLTTFCNRPLNAYVAEGALRLAYYPSPADQWEDLDPESDSHYFEDVLELLRKELRSQGEDTDIMEFLIVKKLQESWMHIGNPQGVTELFDEYFFPFVKEVYGRRIPSKDRLVFGRFYQKASHYAAHEMHERTRRYQLTWIDQGLLDPHDRRSLPLQACDYYLRSGIGHVLLGMRNKNYVTEMKNLFPPSSSTSSMTNKTIPVTDGVDVRK